MIALIADTHAVLWYLGADPKLSQTAKTDMRNAKQQGFQIGVSAISLVEMVYLVEKGRITPQRFSELARELEDAESMFSQVNVDLRIARALSRVDVNSILDMPDRIIAATAVALSVLLISRDGKIRSSQLRTIW